MSKRIEVTIEKIVAGGHGLARTEKGAVLVPRVAPGERVAVELEKPPRARLLKVLEPAVDRVDPCCAVVDKCGGCDLMHLAPEAQKQARIAILKELLPDGIEVVWHEATPARGRTRARWHAKSLGGGRLVVGYKAMGAGTIVDLSTCAVLDPRLEGAVADVRAILATARGEGDIHVALGAEGKPVLSIAWKGDLPAQVFAEADKHVPRRLAGLEIALPDMKSPAKIGDPRPVTIAADGAPLRTPAGGFAQASEVGDRALGALMLERAQPQGLKVVELFAGSGNFTVALARSAASVLAVEIAPNACEAARENLKARGLTNAKVVAADADAYAIPATDVVVLDPPRAGARGAMAAIVARKVKRVVYVSCDPTTLARDIEALPGYSIVSVDAVNMFPETSHVETIVTLERGR